MSWNNDIECDDCRYCTRDGGSTIYCSAYGKYYSVSEKKEEENRGNDCYRFSRGTPTKGDIETTGCYITTIVCDILGFEDDCTILKTLRKFRNDVMQKDPNYREILYEYDAVGPQIARSIREDRDYDLINGMLDFYILPVIGDIRDKKYPAAVDKYKAMTKSLENYYGIIYDGTITEDYDYQQGGHGKIKKLGEYPVK